MKRLFSAVAICIGFIAIPAAAQQAAQTQASQVQGTALASIAPGAVNITSNSAPQLPWTAVDQDFHTNQAASAPANIGSTSSSAGGCPAVDGWSGSIVVINGGKTTAQELPGCMLNILTDRIGQLRTVEVDGTLADGSRGKVLRFDAMSVMKLESWCLYPLYKQAIENGGLYLCKATRDDQARQRANGVAVVTPGVVDPYIAQSGRTYPSNK